MWKPWRAWVVLLALGQLLLPLASSAKEDGKNSTSKGGSKKCAGRYKGGIVNLCPEHWPDDKAEKVWFILFYAPFCGHCRALEPKFIELAKELRDEEMGIGLGAIDCNEIPNQNLCEKNGVHGYPTMMAMVMGKQKVYHGARDTRAMKAWITGVHDNKGSKGGSKKCPPGVFKSKVRDAVVPLCEAHFPQEKSKNAWIIVFYEENSPHTDFRDEANRAAIDLGSEPPDKSKALKQEPMKRRDRLHEIEQKYELSLEMPGKGPFGSEALAKIGSLCCDCTQEMKEFCGRILPKSRRDSLPVKAWVDKGEREFFDGDGLEAKPLVEFALQRLGFTEKVDPDKVEL